MSHLAPPLVLLLLVFGHTMEGAPDLLRLLLLALAGAGVEELADRPEPADNRHVPGQGRAASSRGLGRGGRCEWEGWSLEVATQREQDRDDHESLDLPPPKATRGRRRHEP